MFWLVSYFFRVLRPYLTCCQKRLVPGTKSQGRRVLSYEPSFRSAGWNANNTQGSTGNFLEQVEVFHFFCSSWLEWKLPFHLHNFHLFCSQNSIVLRIQKGLDLLDSSQGPVFFNFPCPLMCNVLRGTSPCEYIKNHQPNQDRLPLQSTWHCDLSRRVRRVCVARFLHTPFISIISIIRVLSKCMRITGLGWIPERNVTTCPLK